MTRLPRCFGSFRRSSARAANKVRRALTACRPLRSVEMRWRDARAGKPCSSWSVHRRPRADSTDDRSGGISDGYRSRASLLS